MFKKLLPFLSLFSSVGTLLCCALPALFVSLGLGATFVSILGAFPQLIWVSEHKAMVFLVAGLMLFLTVLSRRIAQGRTCPPDPEQAAQCSRLRYSGSVVFLASLICYLVGGFFAFVAPAVF